MVTNESKSVNYYADFEQVVIITSQKRWLVALTISNYCVIIVIIIMIILLLIVHCYNFAIIIIIITYCLLFIDYSLCYLLCLLLCLLLCYLFYCLFNNYKKWFWFHKRSNYFNLLELSDRDSVYFKGDQIIPTYWNYLAEIQFISEAVILF